MSNRDQLKSMYTKLTEMNEFLGGDKLGKKQRRGNTEFEMIKNDFLQKRHEVEKMLEERDRPNPDQSRQGRLNYKIREGITSMTGMIDGMNHQIQDGIKKVCKVQKQKTPQQMLAKQQKILDNCRLLLEELRNRASGYGGRPMTKVQTLTDMKVKLLREIDVNANQMRTMDSSEHLNAEDNEEELQAMEDFRKVDKQMDDRLDNMIVGIATLNRHAKNINQANDVVAEKVRKNTKAVKGLSQHIETENEKLKKIIKKFKPFNCCLWVTLFLCVAGLVVIIVNMSIKRH